MKLLNLSPRAVIAYGRNGRPALVLDRMKHQLELYHGSYRSILLLPAKARVGFHKETPQPGMDYGVPIRTEHYHKTIASYREAKTAGDNDIIIVKHEGINIILSLPAHSMIQLREERFGIPD